MPGTTGGSQLIQAPEWTWKGCSPEELIMKARQAQQYAYAPYSHFRVGAALLLEDGFLTGCNVENASYGLSICAERNVLAQFVAGGKENPQVMAVVGEPERPCYPCGACRQVLFELMPDIYFLLESETGPFLVTLRELLPLPFDAGKLRE
jgi:cytidine deaminase